MVRDQPEDNAIYELFPNCQFQSPRNFDALRNRQIEKDNPVVTLSANNSYAKTAVTTKLQAASSAAASRRLNAQGIRIRSWSKRRDGL